MNTKASPLQLLALIIFISSTTTTTTTITAFNITNIFTHYPDFNTFSNLLTQTSLAQQINNRQTITVLAVDNAAMSAISGRDTEELKNILQNHVVLDYYDDVKLKGMKDKTTMLTTMYQSTGQAQKQNGFLNCTKTQGNIAFGSAVKGSPLNSKLVKVVYQQPFNISIIQVSMPIVSPGIGAPVQAPPPPPFTPPPASPPNKAPPPTEEDDFSPVISPEAAPEPSTISPSPSDGPALAPGPAGPSESKAADEDEAEPSDDSATSKLTLSFGLAVFMALIASIVEL